MSFPGLFDEDDNALDIGGAGGALATAEAAEATYYSDPGEIAREDSEFSFAGTNTVLGYHLGARTRPIRWSGRIVCSTAALQAIRAAQDVWKLKSGPLTFVDDDGTEYAGCRLRSFFLGQKRAIQQRGNYVWSVEYRIELEQLEP